MREAGKAAEYLQSYLDAAFVDGIDISSESGLRQVVERIGLPWGEARPHLGDSDWQAELEDNVQAMNRAGLWGVPSFRVSGGNKPHGFSCWGQDRLWRIESEIVDRAPT
jgi:2-hydroxychromene-2-carboxylate isomerase